MTSEYPQTILPRDVVYFLDLNGKIRRGTVGETEPPYVTVDVREGNVTTAYRRHRAEVFLGNEIVAAAVELDLGAAEILSKRKKSTAVIESILRDPTRAGLLAAKLAAEAISRFFTEPTPEDMGLRTVEQLNGSAEKYNSNIWKVNRFISEIKSGRSMGAAWSCELNLARFRDNYTADVSPERVSKVRAAIDQANFEALGELYETYGVNFDDTRIEYFLNSDSPSWTSVTVYPAPELGISFVETRNHPSDLMYPTDPLPVLMGVEVHSGVPNFSYDEGCLK